jgi:hypothetical protein
MVVIMKLNKDFFMVTIIDRGIEKATAKSCIRQVGMQYFNTRRCIQKATASNERR